MSSKKFEGSEKKTYFDFAYTYSETFRSFNYHPQNKMSSKKFELVKKSRVLKKRTYFDSA